MSNDDDCTVFVGNLGEKITEELLFELFLQAGPLRNVRIPKDPATKKNRRFGFVIFQHQVSVDYAIKLMNGIRLFDAPLKLNISKNSRNNSNVVKEENSFHESEGHHRGGPINRGGRTPRSIDARGQFSPMYDSPVTYDLTGEEEDFDPRFHRNGNFHHQPTQRGRRGGMGASPMMRTPGGRHGDMRRVIKEEPHSGRRRGQYQSTPRDQRRFRDRESYDEYSPQNSPRHQPYDRRSRRGRY